MEEKRTTTTNQRITCHERVELGEASMASLLSADLDVSVPGHEILVATHDGLLMTLTITPTSADGRHLPPLPPPRRGENEGGAPGADSPWNGHNINDPAFVGGAAEQRGSHGPSSSSSSLEAASIPAWESEVPGASRFGFEEPAPALVIKDWTRNRQHVIGEAFSLAFDVGEAATEGRDELLRIKVRTLAFCCGDIE